LLREFCLDFLDTIRPDYGAMNLTVPAVKAVTTTDSGIVYTAAIPTGSVDYVADPNTGVITRSNGPASATIQFSIDCQAPNNTVTTFTLYVDGVATPWAVSNTSTGAGDLQSYAFSGVSYSANLNPTYEVRVKGSAAHNVTLSNGILVVQNVPVNTN
jgi:hypothetical protein